MKPLNKGSLWTTCDFKDTPFLNAIWAMANLMSTAPSEFRSVLQIVPFELSTFPLPKTKAALTKLRLAQKHFKLFSAHLIEAGFPEFAKSSDEFALWLKIRDPESRSEGIEELKRCFYEPKTALQYTNFALHFGLEINLENIQKQIDREMALSGGTSSEAAMARFSLAFSQSTPAGVADYIEKYRDELVDHVNAPSLGRIEIEILARAGRISKAQERLEELKKLELDPQNLTRLERMINEGEGENPVALRIEEYEKTKKLSALNNVLTVLEEQDDVTQLAKYARMFFDEVPSEESLARLVNALWATNDRSEIIELMEAHPDFVDRLFYLRKMKCLTLYELGRTSEALGEMASLQDKADDSEMGELEFRLDIATGNWQKLSMSVEKDWSTKADMSSTQLMQTAHLAKTVDSPRLLDLLIEATSRDEAVAELYLTAYHLAVSANLEKEAQKYGWLQKATELSGDTGPVQRISLPDLASILPDWEDRDRSNWQEVKRGQRPMFIAAHNKNSTLCEEMLLSAIGNLSEPDPRRRSLIYTHPGIIKTAPSTLKRIALEPTALITMMMLGLYQEILEQFDEIFLPHTTLAWLLEERQRVQFHQPSQVDNALKIRNLLQLEGVSKFRPNRAVNSDLVFEVGKSLSDMIVEASTIEEKDPKTKYVIRPAPVHRITNLLFENVDLSKYKPVLVSCTGLVKSLSAAGFLTVAEQDSALAYLRGHEEIWPEEPEISENSHLYLDGLSVTYLLPFGILEKAVQAGHQVFIEAEESHLVSQLIKYSGFAEQAGRAIEELRRILAEGLSESRIKLGPLPVRNHREDDETSISQHPCLGFIDVASRTDAVISDDRYFNQSAHIQINEKTIPILSVSDLMVAMVDQSLMTKAKMWGHRITMRRAGYMLLDLSADELGHFISVAKLKNGKLLETAELKAIRENWQMAKMFKAASLPKDAHWVQQTIKNVDLVLKQQWTESISDDEARAKSNWLLEMRDMTSWASALESNAGAKMAEFSADFQIVTLLSPNTDQPETVKSRYWSWIEDTVLSDLKLNEPDRFDKVVAMVSDGLIGSTKQIAGDEE